MLNRSNPSHTLGVFHQDSRTVTNRHRGRQGKRASQVKREGEVWQKGVRTAGEGLKDEKKTEVEGGRNCQPKAGPPCTLLISKPPAWSVPIRDLHHVHNLPVQAHVSGFTLYCLYLSLLKLKSSPSNTQSVFEYIFIKISVFITKDMEEDNYSLQEHKNLINPA